MTTSAALRAEAERLQKQIADELKKYIHRVVIVKMPEPPKAGAK